MGREGGGDLRASLTRSAALARNARTSGGRVGTPSMAVHGLSQKRLEELQARYGDQAVVAAAPTSGSKAGCDAAAAELSDSAHDHELSPEAIRAPGWLEHTGDVALRAGELPHVDMTSVEEELVRELRLALLQYRGLAAPPQGFYGQFFTRGRLLTYLRANGGSLKAATPRACECLDYIMDYGGGMLALAAAAGDGPDLFTPWTPTGFYGHDRRGVPVLYAKAAFDGGGLVAAHGYDSLYNYLRRFDLLVWHALWSASLRSGKCQYGLCMVVDAAPFTIGRFHRQLETFDRRQIASWPRKEHPLPEGIATVIVCNVPVVLAQLWAMFKYVLPRRDRERVHLFSSGSKSAYLKKLAAHVDLRQVPSCFSGEGTAPWRYGEGGDVPAASRRKSHRSSSKRLSWTDGG